MLNHDCIFNIQHTYYHSDDDALDLQSLQGDTDIESCKHIDPKKLTGTYAVR